MKDRIKTIVFPFYKAMRVALLSPIGYYQTYKELQLSAIESKFAKSLSFFKPKKISTNEGILLVQMLKDYEYTIRLAAASKAIAEKHNLKVHFYGVYWVSWIGWYSRQKKASSYFSKPRIEKIYSHFGKEIIFDCEDQYHDQLFIKEQLEIIKSGLIVPADILNISVQGVLIGDLIYDTYLRYFHQPTIESINKEVSLVIEIALNIFYNFTHFLTLNKVKGLVNIYSGYIEHGITARICLHKNIAVYTVGSHTYVIQKLSTEFPYHQIDHTLFSPNKKLSLDQLELAKQKFIPRFEGKNDAATSYMRTSAFSDKATDPKLIGLFAEKSRNIIIYAHDFYDAPHVNRMLQFPDLYQFLKQTLAVLVDLKDTNVFIKLHPNGIKGSKELTIELVKDFNKAYFHILDESVSNLNIIDLKPDLIATARGTVCLEMAYFGIPTVALFDNLYSNFNFTHTCPDKESYFSILKGEQHPKNDFNKEEIFSFYYQAYLEKIVPETETIFTTLQSFNGDTYNERYLEFLLSGEYPEKRSALVEYYKAALPRD